MTLSHAVPVIMKSTNLPSCPLPLKTPVQNSTVLKLT